MTRILNEELIALSTRTGQLVKELRLVDGQLSELSTASKASLVQAINEVHALALSGSSVINDAASAGVINKTWSADKIGDYVLSTINGLKTELLGGVPPEVLNSFTEFADAIQNGGTQISALLMQVSGTVHFDYAQSLTAEQKTQARTNVGSAAAADLAALTAALGNTDVDLVAVLNAALV